MFLYEANYTGTQMARHFNCCTKVVYRRLKEEGLTLSNRYSTATDAEIDSTVAELKKSFPNSGSKVYTFI